MITKLIVALILPIINLSAQILTRYLLSQNKINPLKELSGVEFILQMLSIPGIWLVAALQFCGFVLWGFVISRMELGVANALAGSLYYTLSALAAMLVFGEVLSLREWGGIALISIGVVVLLSKTSF